MKVIVVGATGRIGKALVQSLEPFHEVVKVGCSRGDYLADITNKESNDTDIIYSIEKRKLFTYLIV